MRETMMVYYFSFLLITLACILITGAVAKKMFASSPEYDRQFRMVRKLALQLSSILALISMLVIFFTSISAMAITYLCIPFFVLLMYVFMNFFKLRKSYKTYGGKNQ
ncbi:hypothetical protein LJC61_00770 [Ruminococcaceae bacterium OttesenSCG-928-A16]|nr:hypothetical protein [Ruminococcaceae bacterium OttesenSCG-928-A16]